MSHAGRGPPAAPPPIPQRPFEKSSPPPPPVLRPSGSWDVVPRPWRAIPQESCLAWEATACFRHVCEKSPWAAGCPPGKGLPGLLSHSGDSSGSHAHSGQTESGCLVRLAGRGPWTQAFWKPQEEPSFRPPSPPAWDPAAQGSPWPLAGKGVLWAQLATSLWLYHLSVQASSPP